MYSDGLVVGADRTAATTRCRPQTWRTSFHSIGRELLRRRVPGMELRGHVFPVERLRQHSAMSGDEWNTQLPGAIGQQQVADERLRGREQTSRRRVRRVLEPVVRPVDANQHLHLVIV